MQETSPDELMSRLKAELDGGVGLQTLITAGALANARTFGGQNYNGYHAFMAMVPSLAMSRHLQGRDKALPVFKVLYRNASFIQDSGGRRSEMLHPVASNAAVEGDARARLLAAGRSGQFEQAESLLAGVSGQGAETAFSSLQPLIRDNIDVHQVVLAFRSWDMMALAGPVNGQVLLRQTMRQCIDRDERRRQRGKKAPAIRALLPELMETNELNRETRGTRRLSASQYEELVQLLFTAGREEAARAVAARLAEGVARDDVGEALSQASVRLLLHDPGRSSGSKGKPVGSVHGASVGLHAADTANAWRGIVAASSGPDANASLVTAAWHTAGQSRGMDPAAPHHASARSSASEVPAEKLLDALSESLQAGEQARTCALVERYGELDRDPDPLVAILLQPAIENDGALHHEKYFLTGTQEFARTRPEYRWDHLVALARVMASGRGFKAQGLDVAEKALSA
jgi:hypothetical protein